MQNDHTYVRKFMPTVLKNLKKTGLKLYFHILFSELYVKRKKLFRECDLT